MQPSKWPPVRTGSAAGRRTMTPVRCVCRAPGPGHSPRPEGGGARSPAGGVGDHCQKPHPSIPPHGHVCPCAPPVRFSPETLNAPCPRQHELRAASSAWAEERQRQSHILRPTPHTGPFRLHHPLRIAPCPPSPSAVVPRVYRPRRRDRGYSGAKPRGQQILGTGPSMTKRGPEDHETRAPKRTSRRGVRAGWRRSCEATPRTAAVPCPRAYPTRRRFALPAFTVL